VDTVIEINMWFYFMCKEDYNSIDLGHIMQMFMANEWGGVR
jgi:hypothetical protein